MSFSSTLMWGGAILALGAGLYIMYTEGFLDDIMDKVSNFDLSFYGENTPYTSSDYHSYYTSARYF